MKYSGIAFEIVAFNLLLIWGGYKLDKIMENKIPWMIILGLILSIIGTLYFIFKRLDKN